MARFGAILMLLVTGAGAVGFGVCAVGGVVGSFAAKGLTGVFILSGLLGALLSYGLYRAARYFGRVLWGPDDGHGLE